MICYSLASATAMGLIAETRNAIRNSPKEIFNAYLFLCTCIFALSGVAKGFDEGAFLYNAIGVVMTDERVL